MNRYQVALDELCECAMEYIEDYDYDENECGWYESLNEDDLKRLREPLQELVEKATPKDVEKTEVNELGYTHECPSCGSYVGTICDGIVHEDKYCCLCGQRLWWGEE